MDKIKVGIYGYGNLGKGVEIAINNNSDMELVGIFTRRDISMVETVFPNSKVFSSNDVEQFKDKIDIMILCGSSANDLPIQGPDMARLFSTIDSYDVHAKVPEYYKSMNEVSTNSKHLSLISCGWDPGLFSLNRCLFESILPTGKNYVFYGKGVSQGHSAAIRRIEGVRDAIQYTIPYEDAIKKVREGNIPSSLSASEMMWRECFVVLEEGADSIKIEKEIKEMPNYFKPYHTVVHFISEEELKEKHSKMMHGGFVLRSGKTNVNHKQITEFSLKLDSNPEFTASVLVAYSRAIYKMKKRGEIGAITVLDVPISLLSMKSNDELLKSIL